MRVARCAPRSPLPQGEGQGEGIQTPAATTIALVGSIDAMQRLPACLTAGYPTAPS